MTISFANCLTGRRGLAIALAVTSAAFAVVLTISAVAFCARKKILKRRKGTTVLI